MSTTRFLTRFAAVLAMGMGGAQVAHAAFSYAEARASVQGETDEFQSSTDASGGAVASAAKTTHLGLGEVFVDSSAGSFAGALHAFTGVRGSTSGGAATDIEADAASQWSDTFLIDAPGHDSQTGTFIGSVVVEGGLLSTFAGRAYATSRVAASVSLFPRTGFNGGNTVVTGGATAAGGYDIGSNVLGNPNFLLSFSVPFTFGQGVDVSMHLSTLASLRLLGGITDFIDDGSGRAEADYGSTMEWLGISEVRDSSGELIDDYSALSVASGFDYRATSPAPEPSESALLLIGLLGLVARGVRRARVRKSRS